MFLDTQLVTSDHLKFICLETRKTLLQLSLLLKHQSANVVQSFVLPYNLSNLLLLDKCVYICLCYITV